MDLTLLQLRSFLAAADALNFTAAADRLKIKQPTLSSNIKSLEAAVGGRLFDRDTHSVRLTDLGRACQLHARRLLEELDRAQSDLQRHVQGVAGSIRIAALPHIFPALLAPGLARFRALRPDVSLQFHDVPTQEAIELLRQGHVDLAIVNELGNEPDIRYQLLSERRFVVLMPHGHPLSGAGSMGWRELAGQDLIVVKSRDMETSHLLQSLRQSNVLPPIAHWVNQLSTAVGLVEAGLGLALMAHYTAQHVRRPQFVVRPLVEPEVIGRVSLMTLTHREQSPQIRLLHDALTDTLRSRAQVLAGGG